MTEPRANGENRLEEKLKLLVQPRLLILDEIGYLPIDRLGANLFFQLVSRRYEKGSILITSNPAGEARPPRRICLTPTRRSRTRSVSMRNGGPRR